MTNDFAAPLNFLFNDLRLFWDLVSSFPFEIEFDSFWDCPEFNLSLEGFELRLLLDFLSLYSEWLFYSCLIVPDDSDDERKALLSSLFGSSAIFLR